MTQEDPKPILAKQVNSVRSLAQRSLANYAKMDIADSKEVYLFSKDQFCGVRFTLGAFWAEWRIDQLVFTVHRGAHKLETVDVNLNATNRAA